jgi:hypothetical protein
MANKRNARVSQAQKLAAAKTQHEIIKVRQAATISEIVVATTQ